MAEAQRGSVLFRSVVAASAPILALCVTTTLALSAVHLYQLQSFSARLNHLQRGLVEANQTMWSASTEVETLQGQMNEQMMGVSHILVSVIDAQSGVMDRSDRLVNAFLLLVGYLQNHTLQT